MSYSNNRNKDYETAHHLVSRIAHRVYFLKEDERKDFLEIVRRAAAFVGVRLLGWCVMENHFHLLVFLPVPDVVDEEEILRRYGVLKGAAASANMAKAFAEWRTKGCESRVKEWLDGQRRRMYDVGSFMKIVKQWFTEEYNRRNAHKGTLWESTYYDRIVPNTELELSKCLAYIHLNPIRAAVTDKFDGYLWSSFSAFVKGDATAVGGMRFIYGNEDSEAEIASRHECLLEELLETEKLKRAEEIARRRAAGYAMAVDPLTTEAMVAQCAARQAEVQKALVELREARMCAKRRDERRELTYKGICALLGEHSAMETHQLAAHLSLGMGMTYRILAEMKKRGMICQEKRGGAWRKQ